MGEVIEMPASEAKQKNKLSYEELENVANNLYVRLQQAEMSNVFKRLDYLFNVVKNTNVFPPEFVQQCVDEIISLITIPTENKEV